MDLHPFMARGHIGLLGSHMCFGCLFRAGGRHFHTVQGSGSRLCFNHSGELGSVIRNMNPLLGLALLLTRALELMAHMERHRSVQICCQ